MSLSAFDQWFFTARDEENKIDGVGVPVGTTLLYKFCHNDAKAFEGACALLERAFNAGGAHAVPPNWLPTAKSINVLPEPLRRYIHDMVSNADPAGTVQGVPDDLRKEAKNLSSILASMGEGSYDIETLYTEDQADGDGFVRRAADLLEMLASAPPAPQAKQCEWTNCPTRVGDKCCNEQSSVVQPEPLGFISPKQVERIVDPDGEFGAYIPMRKTPAGNFTLAVYTHPAPQGQRNHDDRQSRPLRV